MTAINSDSANPAYYKWIDGDGTQHFFIRTEESEQGDSVWRCEDIPDYGLTVSAEGTIKIFDKENTCMIFDQNTGYLTTIYDSQEDKLSYRTNMIIITRNGEQITKVRDAAGKEITLSYSSNKLSSITDNRGRTLSYEYTNNNLTKITYPDCKVASYQYDSQNRLEKVIGIDGYSIEYTYIRDKVTEIVEKDGRGNVGRSVSFVYNAKSTRIYDNQNNWAEYVFNDQGIVTSMFDSEGFAANSEYDIEANSRSKFKVLSASNAKKSIINLSKYSNAESSMYWSLNRSNSSDNIETCSTNAYMGNKSIRLKNNLQIETIILESVKVLHWKKTNITRRQCTFTVRTHLLLEQRVTT